MAKQSSQKQAIGVAIRIAVHTFTTAKATHLDEMGEFLAAKGEEERAMTTRHQKRERELYDDVEEAKLQSCNTDIGHAMVNKATAELRAKHQAELTALAQGYPLCKQV